MKGGQLLVSVYLTDADVPGSIIGAWSVCCSFANVDEVVMIRAVADHRVTVTSLHQLTQVKRKP